MQDEKVQRVLDEMRDLELAALETVNCPASDSLSIALARERAETLSKCRHKLAIAGGFLTETRPS